MGTDMRNYHEEIPWMERVLNSLQHRSDYELELIKNTVQRIQRERKDKTDWIRSLKRGDKVIMTANFSAAATLHGGSAIFSFSKGETYLIAKIDLKGQHVFVIRDRWIEVPVDWNYIAPVEEA